MKNSEHIGRKRYVAVVLLFLCAMISVFGFGVLSLILFAAGGGIGAAAIPFVIYAGIRFAEKYREYFREHHRIGSAAFVVIAQLPSVLLSVVLFLLLTGSAGGGAIADIADELIGAMLAAFCGGTALLIMLGTVICSIVTYHTHKKILSQPRSAEETTEV